MSEQKWRVQGSRVYGEGKSFQCTNKINAIDLCNLLNTTTSYDRLNKQLIQINLTLGILTEELHTLNKMVKQ